MARKCVAVGETAADKFRRDANLVFRHAYTLPYILGTIALPESSKADATISRPFSELHVMVYPYEAFRILVQAAGSFLLCIPVWIVLIIGVGLYDLSITTGVRSLAYPLEVFVVLVKALINWRLLRVSSPSGEVATSHNKRSTGVHEQRMILTPEKTFIAVPQADDDGSSPQPPNEVFFYINGIVEQGAMVTATSYLFEQMTGRMCNSLQNPSDGIFLDLLECVIGRDMGMNEEPTNVIVPIVVNHLAKKRKVVIIAHSQGGIILTNVVKELVKLSIRTHEGQGNEEEGEAFHDGLSRLEVYSFCSAADEFPGHETGLFAEHFGAELDFVSRFGSLTFSGILESTGKSVTGNYLKPGAWFGDVYMLGREHGSCQGHLMKQSILPALKAGLFGNESMFWKKYCDKTSSLYKKIDYHTVEDT
jgi:hypothetical protein